MEVSERPPGRAGILVPIRMTTLDGLKPYGLWWGKLGNFEIKSQKHGCSIGWSTLNSLIELQKLDPRFPDFFY